MTATLQQLRIPRVFHRIWFGGPLPARERAFGETWQRHHPGWELRLWQEDDVPPLVNQAAFDAARTPAQKADILRYELLLAHGGVFLDTDFECFRNIEDLLGGVGVFTACEDGFMAGAGLFGSVPGHPFLAAVVAAVPDSLAWYAGRPAREQTGPELFTRVLAEQDGLGHEIPTVFGPELFYPYHWTEPHRAGEVFPDAYAAHHWAKSWRQPATQHTAGEVATRIVVVIDPDLIESAAVVVSGALEVATTLPGVELALVVKGVPEVTEAVGDAISGVVQQLAGGRELPDIVVYGEPEGSSLPAAVRVELSDDPAVNARSLLALALASSKPGLLPAGPPPDRRSVPAVQPPDRRAGPGPRPGPVGTAPVPAAAGVYVGAGRLLVRTGWGGTLYCSGADPDITPDLVLDGVYDQPLCTFVDNWLRPGDACVDVGANVGALAILMARTVGRQGRVIAYEPDPGQAALLRDNVDVNALGDWVDVHPEHPGPLDPVLRKYQPRLVRIAAGGAEIDVLDGMTAWLADARDAAVTVQVDRHRMDERWPRFARRLTELSAQGWQIAAVRPDGTAAGVDLSLILEIGGFDTIVLIH